MPIMRKLTTTNPVVESLESRRLFAAGDPTKIMFLGDSITAGEAPHATYRHWLYNDLKAANLNFDFVGPYKWVHADGFNGYAQPTTSSDPDHYSHAGRTAQAILESLLHDDPTRTQFAPDVAVIMAGNNDLASNRGVAATIASLGGIIDELRLRNPNVKIVLTQILPNEETPQRAAMTVELNGQMPGLAASKQSSASPITVVDQHTGFDLATETYEGVHPNEAGEKEIAAKYAAVLRPMLGGTQQPPPQSGNLRGTVFLDANKNGVQDAGETGIAGRFVFLDNNNNGRREQDEPITVTSKVGNYLFRNLPAGQYRVRHFLGANALPITPGESVHVADVAGTPVTGYAFGVTLTSRISGFIFRDANGNGVRDASDFGVAGRFVYVDSNNNGVFDQGEPTAGTNSIGRYMFTNLPAGDFTVRVVMQAGERTSSPAGSAYLLSLAPGQFHNGATFGLATA